MAGFARVIHEGELPTGAQALAAVGRAFDKIAQGIQQDFNATVRTWSNKPTFVITGIDSAGNLKRTIYTSHDTYYFINYGTRVRRAKMSKDFSPKTMVGVIGSVGGSGHMLFFNRNLDFGPIQGRRFDLAIVKKWQPQIAQLVNQELAKVVKS